MAVTDHQAANHTGSPDGGVDDGDVIGELLLEHGVEVLGSTSCDEAVCIRELGEDADVVTALKAGAKSHMFLKSESVNRRELLFFLFLYCMRQPEIKVHAKVHPMCAPYLFHNFSRCDGGMINRHHQAPLTLPNSSEVRDVATTSAGGAHLQTPPACAMPSHRGISSRTLAQRCDP
jgi:hypothetical protein